jgi:hypothetical protein
MVGQPSAAWKGARRDEAIPTLVVYSPATGRAERLRGHAGREAALRGSVAEAAAAR